ncbi:MAG: prepilin peptidase [Anaerolineales bacterium]|jgi:leader peptidase (prepilin peptidase)/N-methyltransferase
MNLIILPILVGWLAGWLVNYLADVLPVTRSFSRPVCPHCQAPYRWGGYLFFHPCITCGTPRKVRSFVMQAVLTITPVLLWIFPHPRFPFILAFILFIYLCLVFVIDLEHRLILHPVSLFGALLALGIGSYLHGIGSTLIGGVVGFGIMLVFYLIGEVYVRYMSKKRGISTDEVALGFGDVNLSGILGLLLGWPLISIGLLFAVLAGGLISLIIILGMLIAKNYKSFTAIPYAPFLILSALYLLYIL